MGLLKPNVGSIEINGINIVNTNRIAKENALKNNFPNYIKELNYTKTNG